MTLPRRFPERVGAVIFDFDETMIDLEPQHTTASEQLCRSMGVDYQSIPERSRTASGRRIIDDVAEMRDFFGWKETIDELLARRQKFFDDACRRSGLALMPGVERVVRRLHGGGIPLAVASSAVRKSIELILERFGLREFFTLIVDGSEVVRGKPDPQVFLLTAAKLGVSPERCVVFEDSTVGVQAARGAGVFCIAIRNRNAQTQQDLRAADVVVDSFEEVDPGWFTSPPTSRSAPRRAG